MNNENVDCGKRQRGSLYKSTPQRGSEREREKEKVAATAAKRNKLRNEVDVPESTERERASWGEGEGGRERSHSSHKVKVFRVAKAAARRGHIKAPTDCRAFVLSRLSPSLPPLSLSLFIRKHTHIYIYI
jgi:hypothetical protein